MKKTTIVDGKGTRFEAVVFDSKRDAQTYAAQHPVKIRNASGSMISHPAQVHPVKGGKFAVI